MKVELLHNKKINKQYWDNTIKQSPQGLIYAWSIYLDHMCPEWHGLVNEDYSLVMPLTFNKKFGIGYLYQPPFTQQLGIFGKTTTIENFDIAQFIDKAKQFTPFAEININSHNYFIHSPALQQRNNYIVDLSTDYQTIRRSYARTNLQRIKKFSLQYSMTNDIEKAIKIHYQLYGHRTKHVKNKAYDIFIHLCQHLLQSGNAFVREVTIDSELLACSLFLKDEKRIYNIISSTFPKGRGMEANHFLYDCLIKEFCGSPLVLDFEGSDINSIAFFYKKFGATNQPYYFLRWNTLPWWLRWLKE